MLRIDWKTIALVLLAAVLLASCAAPTTPAAQAPAPQQPAAEGTPAPIATDAPTLTPTPKPMTTVKVTEDGKKVFLESNTEKFEITFKIGSNNMPNDAEIIRYRKYSATNVEKQNGNDMMPCNMVNWALGPYLSGNNYTSACYRLWYHEPDTFQVKVYPSPDSRMEVGFTDLFHQVDK